MRQTRRFLLLLTMLLTATFGMSQTIIVKDSITNESIPFVSVYFGNDTGGYTDENGKITSQTIFLVPKRINLDEVAISAKVPKRIKTTEVGSMKAKTQTKHKGANGFEMALFIPYDSTWTETPYIHSILASLDYSTHYLVFTEIKNPIYATLRFDLRLPDPMPPKTSPSLMAASYSLPVRDSARMASALLVLYLFHRQAYSLWWNG